MKNNLAERVTHAYEVVSRPTLKELNIPTQKGLTTLEKWLLSVIGATLFVLSLLSIHSNMALNFASREVQDLQNEVNSNLVEIEMLNQHVQELKRYDRMYSIAQKYGLGIYEGNIRNLSPNE